MRKGNALLLALSLLLFSSFARAADEEKNYRDVPEGAWYASAVRFVTEKEIMTGIAPDTFAPTDAVTRATVLTVLWRLEKCPESRSGDNFPDAREDWFSSAAAWARETGIAQGLSDGTFRGRDSINREQLAVFLYRYAVYKGEKPGDGVLKLYSDGKDISSWAEDAVKHAVAYGYLQGTDGNRIDPKGTADRATLATVLCRMLTPAAG